MKEIRDIEGYGWVDRVMEEGEGVGYGKGREDRFVMVG